MSYSNNYSFNQLLNSYEKVNEALIEKFGKPSKKREGWSNREYYDKPNMLGKAFFEGDVIFVSIWEFENYEVSNVLSNRTILKHDIVFSSLIYGPFKNMDSNAKPVYEKINSDMDCRRLPQPFSALNWGMTKVDLWNVEKYYDEYKYLDMDAVDSRAKILSYDFNIRFCFREYLPQDNPESEPFFGLYRVYYRFEENEEWDEEYYIQVYKDLIKYCEDKFGEPERKELTLRNRKVTEFKPEFAEVLKIGKLNLSYNWELGSTHIHLGLVKPYPEKEEILLVLNFQYKSNCNDFFKYAGKQ